MVVDGQQRITTINLMLSAIMSKAKQLGEHEVVDKIENLMFADVETYKKWVSADGHKMTPEGAILPFYRQIPTFIDRKPFYLALIGE